MLWIFNIWAEYGMKIKLKKKPKSWTYACILLENWKKTVEL